MLVTNLIASKNWVYLIHYTINACLSLRLGHKLVNMYLLPTSMVGFKLLALMIGYPFTRRIWSLCGDLAMIDRGK